jgi:hypothetical protein
MAPSELERIGELLVEEGVVTREELAKAIADSGIKGSALAWALEGSTHVRRAELAAFLAADFRVPSLDDLRKVDCTEGAARLVPEDVARKHELVPIAKIGDLLCVAKANYFNRAAVVELRRVTGLKVKVLQADEGQVRAALERIYKGRKGDLPAPAGLKAARPVEEAAVFEAVPLISPAEDGASAPVAAPARTGSASRLDPVVEEVIEIMDAIRIPSQEYTAAFRDPFTRLVLEFEDLFRNGKAVSPSRFA